MRKRSTAIHFSETNATHHPSFGEAFRFWLKLGFVAANKVMDEAQRLGATPFDVAGVELGHHGKGCSFEAIVKKYGLSDDLALVLLGKIVNGTDTDNTLWNQPEGPGLEAIAEGFRHLGFKDDHEVNAAEWIVYDALCLLLGNGAPGKAGGDVQK